MKVDISKADRMFRKLGYEKVREDELTTIYEDSRNQRIYLKFPGGRYYRNLLVMATGEVGPCELNCDEVIACAEKIKEVKAVNELEQRTARCKNCPYVKYITCESNWGFSGCKCPPYRGKWIVEIENCPLDERPERNERFEDEVESERNEEVD